MDAVTQMIFMIAGLMALGAVGEFIFNRTGIPDMIWLVLAGIVVGPVFQVLDSHFLEPILPFFGAVALVSILAGGGLRLRISEVAEAAPRAFLLAVLGFLLTIIAFLVFAEILVATGLFAQVPITNRIMYGAILGGTSSLVIIPCMSKGAAPGRVARLLELESCITDALCVVVTMMLIGLILQGSFDLGSPFVALGKAIGIGTVIGIAAALSLLPMIRPLKGKAHSYTVILAGFFVTYGAAQFIGGNGALSVLIAALIIGNAPELFRRFGSSRFNINPDAFVKDEAALAIHDHMNFFIKSFFFFLIGLMFPTSPLMILVGAAFAVFMLMFRVPATWLSLQSADFDLRQKMMVTVAIPRGMAAGVLSALPLHYGVPGVTTRLSEGVFSAIVFSILIFTVGFAVLKRLPIPEITTSADKVGAPG